MKQIADNAMSEWGKERIFGGHEKYNKLWCALNDLGIEFIVYSDKSILFIGLSTEGVCTHKSTVKKVLNALESVSPEVMAETLVKFFHTQYNQVIGTHKLIRNHEPSRVLWAFAVEILGGERERTYDNCFENGNGDLVHNAVDIMRAAHSKSLRKKWTVSLAEKAISEVSELTPSLCFA